MEMRKWIVGVIVGLFVFQGVSAQNFPQADPRMYVSDSAVVAPRRPWLAAAEVFGLNMFVYGFNRYVANEDFAQINWGTIKRNFRTGPVWDTDKFSTNLVAHPYHGSLYFNAARTNGMSFWESIPYTVGGSLMWEWFMETEPPSINDLFATSFGGVELGEITYRLSDLFIDNRTTGGERIGREVLSGLISPMRALNRLITGEAWRYSPSKGRTYTSVPVGFYVNTGPRFLAEQQHSKHGTTSWNLALRLDYGDPFDDDFYSPYEWFQLRATFDFFSSQPLITQVNAIGALWGKTIWAKDERTLMAGVFQHFDYYDSELRSSDPNYVPPYRISEAAAVGGGLIYNRKSTPATKVDVFGELYVNAVLLGASVSDYMKLQERDYNLGNGYSIKAFTGLTYNKQWSFLLNLENYHLFTWKGYDPDTDFSTADLSKLNVQGERSHARLTVLSTHLAYFSKSRWNLVLTNRNFTRHTRYKHFPNVQTETYDVLLTLGVRI